MKAIEFLKEKLTDMQLNIFRRTCFGQFLDLPEVVIQNQLIHSLLLREVVSGRSEEIWVKVGRIKLRFGLMELGLMTGLKCNGDDLKDYDSIATTRLCDEYFHSFNKVTKERLIECFNNKSWKCDEDVLKLAILYFIHTFLFSTPTKNFISKGYFHIVDSGEYQSFPRGRKVLVAMIKSMKDTLRREAGSYRYGGLPLAFQTWFYECCPYVHERIANRVSKRSPRILNWTITRKPTLDNLYDKIFKLSSEQVILNLYVYIITGF